MSGFGARPSADGTRFRLLGGYAGACELVLLTGAARGGYSMPPAHDGVAELFIPRAGAGDRYGYRLDGGTLRPDPASRFQPEGVHGPSEVVDPEAYPWSDDHWLGPLVRDLVIYELHVGTFTPSGTFLEARDRLDDLRDLGVTAIELMPIADFPGRRNWGYDGVALYAPSRAYGRPDDLRALVNRAHTLGLAVLLDVVYNHLGPEGAYLPEFNPLHFTDRHETPWGQAINLDGPHADLVRRFLIDSALHWIREYRIDGLRLDATHTLIDGGNRHFVRELSEAVHEKAGRLEPRRNGAGTGNPRRVVLHAEDERNLSAIVARSGDSAWRMDAVWADDFHHVVRRLVQGDSHGYYVDYAGTTAELARTIRQGWLYCGEPSRYRQRARGTDPSGVPMCRFVICLQNHDQIGNRAFGERLHHQIDPATWRAVSTVLLTAPMTPLLFMGQEWAASTPFLFFTDLEPALGPLVTEGRRREFRAFPEFQHVEARDRIPDPQADSTFEASRLRWSERLLPRHAGALALYRALLELRRTVPALGGSRSLSGEAVAPDAQTLIVRREDGSSVWWIVTCLTGSSVVSLDDAASVQGETSAWEVVLTTEDPRYTPDPKPVQVDVPAGPVVTFERPGSVILRATMADPDARTLRQG